MNIDVSDHQIRLSLTTIASRVAQVHRVIESLFAQQFSGAEFDVSLFLSSQPYLLDTGCAGLTPQLEQLQAEHPGRFHVRFVANTGPYRKILPLLESVHALPVAEFERTLIVTTDDDTLYPPDWLGRLYEAYLEHRCIVGFRGRSVVTSNESVAPYRAWAKAVDQEPSLSTVLTGKDGILYSPSDLHPTVLDATAATRVAPKADDLWLKAHSLLLGVPAFAIHDTLAQEFPSVDPSVLDVSLYQAFNRKGGNDQAVAAISRHFSERYGRTFFDLMQPEALRGLSSAICI